MKKIIGYFKGISPVFLVLIFISIAIIVFLMVKNITTTVKVKQDDIKKLEGLPNIMEVDMDKTPMMYDFLNSSLGYKLCTKGYDFNKFGFYYAILQNEKEPENIYVEYYTYGERVIFPILGEAPKLFELNSDTMSVFNDGTLKLSSDRIIKEDGWNLYIVSQYEQSSTNKFDCCDAVGNWSEINFIQFNTGDSGLMKNLIDDGLGWPTEWLRNDIYKESIKSAGYDIDNSFWDKYNINSITDYKNSAKVVVLQVKVTQLNCFEFEYNKLTISLNEEELKEFINTQGLE